MRTTTVVRAVAAGAAMAVLAACGTGSETSSDSTSGSGGSSGPATISWWHNSNTDPGKAYYETVAKDFEAAHPGVKVQVSAMQHEDMLTKLDAAFQSGDAPDVYMERGGGELADHVAANLTKDISEPAKDVIDTIGGSVAGWQVDGKTYALPFSVGVVGFWYNKALFEQGRHHGRPDDHGRALRRRRQAQGRGHRPAVGGCGRQVAGCPLLVLHRAARVPQAGAAGCREEPGLLRPVLRQGRRGRAEDHRGGPVQQGLPVHPRADRSDERFWAARHRQGRDGDAGPLGARRHAGPDRRQEGPGREHRLVRLPDRPRRAGRPERGPRWW